MITNKLTTKAQTTIPQPVRAALHLETGDALAYIRDSSRPPRCGKSACILKQRSASNAIELLDERAPCRERLPA